MAGKQPKVRTKPKTKPEISGPFAFEHVMHMQPKIPITENSPEEESGEPGPSQCPVRASSEYAMGFGLLPKEELKQLIRSEIESVLQTELKPIKTCLDQLLAGDRSNTVVDQQKSDPADTTRGAPIRSNEREEAVYVNFQTLQSNNTGCDPHLTRSSLTNPTYDLSDDENIIPTKEQKFRFRSYSSQTSASSETSLKKPIPAPRPNTSTHPNYFTGSQIQRETEVQMKGANVINQSNTHTAARESCMKRRSLSNPIYDTCEDDATIPAKEKKTKAISSQSSVSSVSSETSVKKMPVPQPRPNTLPRGTASQPSRRPSAPLPFKKAHQHSTANERECLASALQSNIEDIVGDLIFAESELPDELAADSCITDEENSEITKLANKKDQIRVLISTIKGRDFIVLQRFLKRIEKTNKTVADKIKATVEDNRRTLVRKSLCPCCEMKTNVNIKYVVDGLWAMRAISDGLFTEIARYASSTGEQCVLWVRLIDSLNSISNKDLKERAYRRLVCALSNKNHYTYIAVDIEASISKHRHLGCKCKVQFCTDYAGSLTGVSSCTPWSSASDIRYSNDKLSESDKLSELEGIQGEDGREHANDAGDSPKNGTSTNRANKETIDRNGSLKETPSVQTSIFPRAKLKRQNAVDE